MVDKCERCKHWGVRKIGNFTFDYGFCSFWEGEGRGQIAIMDVDGYISGAMEL